MKNILPEELISFLANYQLQIFIIHKWKQLDDQLQQPRWNPNWARGGADSLEIMISNYF
jgi:hypothetical protein